MSARLLKIFIHQKLVTREKIKKNKKINSPNRKALTQTIDDINEDESGEDDKDKKRWREQFPVDRKQRVVTMTRVTWRHHDAMTSESEYVSGAGARAEIGMERNGPKNWMSRKKYGGAGGRGSGAVSGR